MAEKKSRIGAYPMVVLALFFVAALGLKLWSYHWPSTMITLKNTSLSVLLANTPDHEYTGLGGRKSLAPYDGMLFLFAHPGRIGIVMRDMQFPIDIVWFSQGKVVDLAPNVPIQPGVPEERLTVYYPRLDADMVLELPAGWADSHSLRIGDAVSSGAK